MSVRLYGRVVGRGSHAVVTAGFAGALDAAGMLAGLVELDRERAPSQSAPGGALAPHGVLTGPLGQCHALSRNAKHERRWAMVAPNSSRIPEDLAAFLWRECTDLMAPSRWAAEVLTAQYEELSGAPWRTGVRPVIVVPHGLESEFAPAPALRDRMREHYAAGRFTVAHLSTSDRERKGTLALLHAWARAAEKIGSEPRLQLILDPMAATALRVALAELALPLPESVAIHQRVDYGAADMAKAYAQSHVVCQPSRGEGFGMVPLEARACGVPVVATACTGHSEHVAVGDPGVVVVPHGAPTSIDDVPGAKAPSVAVEDIEEALVKAYKTWPQLAQDAEGAAENLRTEWSWAAKLAPWIKQLGRQ